LSSVKTILAWVLALLAVVGIGVGVEAAIGVSRPALLTGTVTGLVTDSGWVAYAPPGPPDNPGFISFYPAAELDGAVAASCDSTPCRGLSTPVASVRIQSTGRFVASLKPGRYAMFAYPCGAATIVVTPGSSQRVDLSCLEITGSVITATGVSGQG
jgi:hypothetical protein